MPQNTPFAHSARPKDLHFRQENLREAFSAVHETMKRTTIQRLFSILSYRKSREATVGPLSVAALAREYREHVKFAKTFRGGV